MSGDNEKLEDYIKQFYDNVPDVNDSLPMKDYLLKHENNQMAWYLLGKQYAARGEEGKANYCFAQAGGVYEAFESKANPLLAAAGEAEAKTKSARRGRKRGLALAAVAAALIALAAIALPGRPAGAPGLQAGVGDVGAAVGTADGANGGGSGPAASPVVAKPSTRDAQSGSGDAESSGSPGAAEAWPAFVSGAADPETDGPGALGRLLTRTPASRSSVLVQTPMLDDKWTDWVKSGKPLAAVSGTNSGSGAAVEWYDPQWCPCKTGLDAAAVRKQVAEWKPLQESKLVLRSAMIHYKERTGKWPKTAAQLAAAYPGNTMAGWAEEMTPWLNEMSEELARIDGKVLAAPTWPGEDGSAPPDDGASGAATPAGKLEPLTERPLELIVDKKNHRLAVVSGGILLRNYEVGLGGDKTPEGTFVISEKVKDPVGSQAGEFGTRGMALSDTLYAIHGTNEPDSIGKDESHGCVRMKQEDVEELYDLVSLGTKVTIVKEGLPRDLRAPAERFRLEAKQNETNPRKKYNWLN